MRQLKHSTPRTIKCLAAAVVLGLGCWMSEANAATKPLPVATPVNHAAVEGDIRDIRPPIHIPNPWLWAEYAAAGLAIAGLAYAGWRWHHRAKMRELLAYELALKELEAARAWISPGHAYEYSIAVSEAVRHYIEQRFSVRAAHRTTEEFLRDVLEEPRPQLAAYRMLLSHFLMHCDLAKFALWQLSVPEMDEMHQSACTFVIETGKPVAPVPVTAGIEQKPSFIERTAS
jgi:hypothetical protein